MPDSAGPLSSWPNQGTKQHLSRFYSPRKLKSSLDLRSDNRRCERSAGIRTERKCTNLKRARRSGIPSGGLTTVELNVLNSAAEERPSYLPRIVSQSVMAVTPTCTVELRAGCSTMPGRIPPNRPNTLDASRWVTPPNTCRYGHPHDFPNAAGPRDKGTCPHDSSVFLGNKKGRPRLTCGYVVQIRVF